MLSATESKTLVDRIVMPISGMRWMYQRTFVPVTIVKVKPKPGWPHHTLRAIFQDGKSALTFHCEMIGVYFRQVPVEASKTEAEKC